jgi:hypothetical protein
MGQKAAGRIKRCGSGQSCDESPAVRQKTRVTEVTRLPAPELQHLRAFPAAVGVTRAPRMQGYHGYHDREKGNPVTGSRISGLPRRGYCSNSSAWYPGSLRGGNWSFGHNCCAGREAPTAAIPYRNSLARRLGPSVYGQGHIRRAFKKPRPGGRGGVQVTRPAIQWRLRRRA